MTTWLYEKYKSNQLILDRMTNVIKPLESFNLNHFAYNQMDSSGDVKYLCNNIPWMLHYFENQGEYIDGLIFDQMIFDCDRKSKIYWDPHSKNKITEELKRRDVVGGFSYFVKNESKGNIISFHFGSNNLIDTSFFNRDKLITDFILYFLSEMGSSLDDIAVFKENTVGSKICNLVPKIPEENLFRFKKISVTFQGIRSYITYREYQVLSYLSQGQTAKEIGRTLGISSRTVESFLENIRSKFGLYSKQSLIRLYAAILTLEF